MSNEARPKLDPKIKGHGRIIRATSYCVASLLAILTLTAALPPIIADESDRAVLDAPVTLLTTPIAGVRSARGRDSREFRARWVRSSAVG